MPTQTYTPTASWNNTSQYQQNGDVSDAAVAQLTGEDAMDNIAYLTGANNLTQVRQLSTVADLAALKAVTTQRDQDYITLDSNKRMYQFDSGSAATGDDYSVVQPTSGTGRYILQSSAVPKSTTHRWVASGWSGTFSTTVSSGLFTIDGGGRPVVTNNSAGGTTITAVFQFNDFNLGDVISQLEISGTLTNAAADVTATFYSLACTSGSSAPTVTTLGTVSSPASAGAFNMQSALGSPVTITAGLSVLVSVDLTNDAGTASDAKLYFVALDGTRSYITE